MEYLDEKTAMAVERRRKMEEERKQRIFNEKVRSKGVDLEGIDDQIRMKRELREQEEARERAIAEELSNIERQVQILAQRHEEAKKKVSMDVMNENQMLSQYRRTQTPPKQIEMDRRALGASNMLVFLGEDEALKDRTRAQQAQLASWNDEQARLKNQRIRAEKEADLLYEQQTRAMYLKIAELEKEHVRAKNSVKAADRDYNKYLSDSKKDREIQARMESEQASHYHVASSLVNPLLTEKGSTTSSLSPSRVVPYAFKGMTPDQRQAILDEQDRQRREKEDAKRAKEEEERMWAAQQAAVQRTAMLKEREVSRAREDINRRLQNDHARMAREKGERDQATKSMYANRASDDFFSQFNTSSR